METEFREEQKEKSKEIVKLSKDILALKTTLIGIDGNNGMRSQIAGLSDDITEIKTSLNIYLKTIYDIKAQESRYDLLFSTKVEQRELEDKLCKQLEDVNDKLEADIDRREELRIQQEAHIENLGVSKKALTISFFGILITTIIGLFI